MAKIIEGRRGGKVLVNEGFIYQKYQARQNCIYWRCSSIDCRAPLRTDVFYVNEPPEDIEVENVGAHNHPPMDEAIDRQVIVSRIKENVVANPSAPIRRVYDAAIADDERSSKFIFGMVLDAI